MKPPKSYETLLAFLLLLLGGIFTLLGVQGVQVDGGALAGLTGLAPEKLAADRIGPPLPMVNTHYCPGIALAKPVSAPAGVPVAAGGLGHQLCLLYTSPSPRD